MRREVVAARTGPDLTSGNACWETPPAIFEKLSRDFGPFDIDLTADAQRHLLPKWFGPGSALGEDALTADWLAHGDYGYSNPPYGPFVQKLLRKAKLAAATVDRNYGFTTTLLLPMRVTRAFRTEILDGAAGLLFCDKRITFYENGAPRINPKTGKPDAAMFDSIIVRYLPGVWDRPEVGVWQVPTHV